LSENITGNVFPPEVPAPMPRLRIPKYRRFKPKDLGLVVLDGKQHYLGRYGSAESVAEYNRLIQGWLARGPLPRTGPAPGDHTLSINDLILAFWTRHAETHYRHADGTPSGELANYRDSLRPLRRLYGPTLAAEFSPLRLKDLRKAMIASGLSRGTINQRVGRVVRVFKWGASEELVPAGVHDALKTVGGLPKGRSEAREPAPVQPVPAEAVEAVRPHVARQVWAMIELQRLTARRPGEVVIMRTSDLDTSGEVWLYTPARHKTAHHGRERAIFLGPRAREIVSSWLRPDPAEYLFSPREAMAEFRAVQRRNRTTPLYPSQQARAPKANPGRTLGDRYSVKSYHHAIGYGCRKVGIPAWHPNQLRHSAATVILGHSSPVVTEVYAELDRGKASTIMAEIG